MAVIGSLSVKLGLVTVEWDKATAKAKQQAKDLQSAFNNLGIDLKNLKNTFAAVGGAMGIGIAGFAALSKATLDYAGQVDDLSKSYDVSIATLLQYQKAIVLAGGKTEDANKMLSTMFSKIAEAQSGNEAAIATFEDLGISFKELNNTSPDQMIRKVYEGLANIGNTYERIKATKEILGKGGMGKSVSEIAEALGESNAAFKKQEESLKKLADLGDALDATYGNLKLAIADLLAPFTSAKGDALVSIETIKAAFIGISSAVVVGGMFKLVEAFVALNKALRATASLGLAISAAGGIKGIAMAGAGLAAYFGAKKVFEMEDETPPTESTTPTTPSGNAPPNAGGSRREIVAAQAKLDLQKKMLDLDQRRQGLRLLELQGAKYDAQLGEAALKREEDIAKAESERAAALNKENLSGAQRGLIQQEYNLKVQAANQKEKNDREFIIAQRDKELMLMKQQGEFMVQMEIFNQKALELDSNRYQMTDFEYRKAKELLDLEKKRLELRQQLKEAEQKYAAGSPELEVEKERINNAIKAEEELSAMRVGKIEEEKARQESFVEGWKSAFRQFSEDAENYSRVGAESFNAIVSNMNTAIDTFVRTGKLNFKDFAKSIIQDLIAIEMKMQAMQLLKMAIGGIGGFLGFGSAGAGGGSGGSMVGGFGSVGGASVMTAADGGYINQPTLVGENGAEMFIPGRQGGTIIPTQQLAGMASSQPQIVYNAPVVQNLSAIDTQSGIQFLTKNKSAIYAANQSATRSLPASR